MSPRSSRGSEPRRKRRYAVTWIRQLVRWHRRFRLRQWARGYRCGRRLRRWWMGTPPAPGCHGIPWIADGPDGPVVDPRSLGDRPTRIE